MGGPGSVCSVLPRGEWILRQTPSVGGADARFTYGGAGDVPVVGDWNGDGRAGIGVFRPSTREWILRQTPSAGGSDLRFQFGAAGDRPVSGTWAELAPPSACTAEWTPPGSFATPPRREG